MVDFTKLNLLGKSLEFTQVLQQIDRFARCDAALLINGETGIGKELVARAIHYLSQRRDGPFLLTRRLFGCIHFVISLLCGGECR